MRFTVCTPTFNRAHTIHLVFESLKEQTFTDFEWLVIDDGSDDETSNLIKQWQSEAFFPIRYKFQENQGKHIAVNLGVELARGELFLVADSDDSFKPEALEVFGEYWFSIPSVTRMHFAGVTALCEDERGKIVGDVFPKDILDTTSLEITYRYRVRGEKWGFYRTDVLKKFPSPGPKNIYFGESVVWHAISREFKTRFINVALRTYKQTAGNQLMRRSPRESSSSLISYVNSLNEDHDYFFVAPLFFLRIASHGVRFSLHKSECFRTQLSRLKNRKLKLLWIIACVPGVALYSFDLLSDHRNQNKD